MSDSEEAEPRFTEDGRVVFIGGKVCGLLGLQLQTWEQSVLEQQHVQTVITQFFQNTHNLMFFSLAPDGSLTAGLEVPPAAPALHKHVYLLKKRRGVPLDSDSCCRELVLFGSLVSQSAMQQLSNTVEQVWVPLLSAKTNQVTWPNLLCEDISRHAEKMRNKTCVVRGQWLGRTVLPVPPGTCNIDGYYRTMQLSDGYDRTLIHTIESLGITWTHLIHKVLKEDSAELLGSGSNPGPYAELDFWASRKSNIENIYQQLQSPIVQKMVKILELVESSYHPTITALIGNVFDALQEARDIELHLRPLRAHLSRLENEEFPRVEASVPALFHIVSLVWTRCPAYRTPARIVVLLQELCNVLIQQASDYLCAEQLLREDVEEGLERLRNVVRVFRRFRDTFHTYRRRSPASASQEDAHNQEATQRHPEATQHQAPCWDFQSSLVFTCYDRFLGRVLQIQDLFETMLGFQRLEKLEFGGLRGRVFSEQAAQMFTEFTHLCQVFKDREYNPLHDHVQDFEKDYTDFKVKLEDFERRLASVLCSAFKDCCSLESAFKLLVISGPFLERKRIKQIFSPNYLVLQQYFREELERCKLLYKSQLHQTDMGLTRNMPRTSGALKWAKTLRERIQTPWETVGFLFDMSIEGVEMGQEQHMSVEGVDMVQEHLMCVDTLSCLDRYEEDACSDWCQGLDTVCHFNLDQPLLSRNTSSGLLSVNFNPELIAVLRDVKYIQALDQINIPAAAMEVFQNRDMFMKYVSSLQLLVQWYNKVKQTALEVELPLIQAELEAIEQQLRRAESGGLTWQHPGCWGFISSTKRLVHGLERGLQRTKDNCQALQALMKVWSRQSVFCRKDSKRGALIMLDDRAERVNKWYGSVQKDGQHIHRLVQENMSLFGAEPTSEEWRSYLEYVDDMVVEGLFKAISRSLEFFVENMESGPGQAPLLEAQLLLRGSELSFVPSLEREAGDGLYELLEGLLGDVFKTSTKVERLAAHLHLDTYQAEMEDMLDLLDLRQEVMERVEKVLGSALQYQTTFSCYTHLWMEDRAEVLRHFLQYGQVLSTEEPHPLPQAPPTIQQFKEQIDYYEDMYSEVSRLQDCRVFDGWFRVDIKTFKLSLLNIIKRWSWLFKEHLMTYVTDSLDGLEQFVGSTVEGLRRPVSAGDHRGLVEVMGHLLALRDRQVATDVMFDPLNATLSLLERYGERILEHVYSQLEDLPEKWSAAKKLALAVRHDVAPMQNAEVMVLRRQCMAFEVKLSDYRERFRHEAPFNYTAVHPYLSLEKAEKEMVCLEEEVSELQESTNLFEVSIPDYRDIKLCRREIVILKELWDLVTYVHSSVELWTTTKWRLINVSQMDAELRRFAKDMRRLDKEARTWDVYCGLDLHVKNLLTSLRAVSELQNLAIRQRHWEQLITTTRVDFTMTDGTTLEDLLALRLHLYEEEVRNVVDKAVKEMAIEKVLMEISQTWAAMEFSYEDHPQTSLPLLRCDEDLIETLEDHQVQLQAVSQSKHVAHFVVEVSGLQRRLTEADAVLTVWMEVQRTWLHLHSIFTGCDDIRLQLPADARRFQDIDAAFQELVLDSAKTRNVIEATNKRHLFEKLEDLQKRLALCEKALAEYLETKRLAFPRFYFVSSADLLDILSKGSRPRAITCHLSKLFDNMCDLEFSEDDGGDGGDVAVGMYSKEREYVPFQSHCPCRGPVEVWLTRLEASMRASVRGHLSEAVSVYEDRSREQWVLDFPAQVALTGSQVWWSNDMDLAFRRLEEGFESALKDYNKKQIVQLNSLINMLLGELSSGDRQKIMTICTIDVHARDVVSNLISLKVSSSQAFRWMSQLRHRWDDTEQHCYADICDAHFLYSYEYLGNTPRLVITPLTDRCYITLTQSLHLTMSGAPAGPAGTGKTETTKDLGRALGVMVYVFNCSEQMDYKSIGNIYKGLTQTGAWGCFDEFNRISVEVLSVVAVQVKTIQDAIRMKKKRFLFLDEDISLKPSVGIFITMNPGYAGRTELPENLKALFRPCAMVVPDVELICEIMLVAEGFLGAKLLARKFITLYTLCRELLSKQDHYDWGLRAVKSVLVVAGSLRRGDKTRPEDQVLMRALRDFNMPKIVTEDVAIFLGLLGDLFPGLVVERSRDPGFEQAVRRTTLELRLQPEEAFILKVVQLEELLAVRHSVFVIGNAGTGKSQILRVLNKTYASLKRKPVWNDLNPKAVETDELFGFIHPATREWKDGLLSSLLREQASMAPGAPKWIVLDGDIDPMWIESLNTVMDDNKVLTLASNERVPLTCSMRLLFEVSHLRSATPATVSRAGILCVNPQDVGWSPYVASWIDTRVRQTERAHLIILFDKYLPRCMEQMRSTFRTITPIPESSMVQTLCSLLDCLLTPENIPSESPRELYETYFTFACIWAFGGALHQDQLRDYRLEFSQWWTKEMKTVKLPAQGTVFDYFLDPQTRRFLPWSDTVPQFVLEPDAPLQSVLVPTVETARLGFLVELLLQRGQPVMLVGGGGVGKTALIRNLLDALPAGTHMTTRVPFNYYTTSLMLQTLLEGPLEKKAGRSYAPQGNRKLVYFIDDMNMPAVDGYGTVQPHTLIRQHLDYKHWYDRQKLSLKDIHNTQYVACMNPTAGNFHINPRLQRHFSVFAVNFPSAQTQTSIYGQILAGHLQQQPFGAGVHRVGGAVVQASIALHHRVVSSFLPTALRFHYLFSLRELSSVFQGLLFSRPEVVSSGLDLVLLWCHETSRVYSDRLVDTRDLQMFHRLQMDTVHQCFEGVEDVDLVKQPLLYCHLAQQGGAEESLYTPIRDWAVLLSLLTEALESYNELNAAMNLVLFEDAMEHVCRISRILESPRGHGLLVGVGGSGKQSLTRLAAHLSSTEVFQITLSKSYSITDLKGDLAGLYLKAGVKKQRVALLLTDAHIPDERFLVPINDLLTSGEIPDLLGEEETEGVVSAVRAEVRALGLLDTRDACWRFFMERVRLQLKVVLCLSPVGGALSLRARRFPALVHCTTMDWFHPWSPQALQSVSRNFIQDIPGIEPTVQESISLFMAHVHTSVDRASEKYRRDEKRHNYTTPKSFLQHIGQYAALLAKSRAALHHNTTRLEKGLDRLRTTAQQVEDLKAKLASQEAELTVKNQKTEALITKVGLQTEKVSRKREAADAEAQKVAAIQVEVTVKQRDCETDLLKAEPALEAAKAALDTLNKVNLTELKTFPNPPAAVINVAAAVMVLLAPRGRVPKERSWKAARAFMGKVDDFLQALVSYDKEHIPDSCLSVVKQHYLRNPDFHPDLVTTKSTAAAGLCAWTINIVRYYEVYCEVAPKRLALSQANTELETATAKLLAVQKKLEDLDVNLQNLTSQFQRATAEKLLCQGEVFRTNQTISLANRLVQGLESERERWSQSLLGYQQQLQTLCGDVLLTSAYVSYLGYFTRQYRLELLHHAWIPFLKSQKVPIALTEGLDPVLLLADGATVAGWHNQGLPNDRMSWENAAILTASERWPLLVDPQQQAAAWIRERCGPQLRVLTLGQRGYLDVIERALSCGETVLLENLTEKMDPVLEPLLARNTIKRGRYIRLGGKECEYNSSFQLILHTKLANPHFPPELQAQTTLINFTVTPAGLEEQLLGQVVTWERPDLEALKMELTTQQNRFKIQLKALEDELLGRLSAAQGHFLGDMDLVEQLETTKTTAKTIYHKVSEARANETEINEARELYRPAAHRASMLYFIINQLSVINPMYQFSLKTFNSVFHKAMQRAAWDDEVGTRVLTLTEAITHSVFLFTSQGLFQRDRLTFLSHIAFQVLLKQGLIDGQELDFLLRFPVEPSRAQSPVSFLSAQAWGAIKTISTLEELSGLDRDMESSPKRWRKIVESECPEMERLPQEWKNLSSLHKLIVLRALRPDRMTYALRMFVEETMGSRYVETAGLELEKSFEESEPSTPLFFILSAGVDPLKDVEKLGVKLGFSMEQGSVHNVSLGQGQEEVAERVLRRASQHGHWVILQNVHLVSRWLPSLEVLVESVAVDSHPDYRLFISGEPAADPEQHVIPRGLLENAIKITSEPPTGMNASLHAALNNFSQDTLEMCCREQEFNAVFFSLCYFHACVTERRKFGPQGWNRSYPFNTGDLTISVNVLYNYLEANSKVPWEDLCYLFGEIMYGGHITDDWDRRLCRTYLQGYMTPRMFEGELSLCPGFLAPPFLDYSGYHGYVDEHLPPESPALYGLHPNAELETLGVTSHSLFRALLELQPRGTPRGEGSTQSTEEKVKSVLDDILERLPEEYNMADIMAKTAQRSPYVLVCFQECERMNVLLAEMTRSLTELDLALKGELTMSTNMEALQAALFTDTLPVSWDRLSSPSTKTLTHWFSDVLSACRELDSWTQDLVLPAVVWLSGFFNPQSFLTAVMQSIARRNQWPLDQMTLTVDVTKKTRDDYGHPPREGAYIHGLYMDGARWDTQSGVISDAALRELTPAMPVLYVRAVPAEQQDLANTYQCPVYRTKRRGNTYVCTFHLRTKQPPAKWTLAGVALLLSV